jgi:hypothetical protein
MNQIPNNPQLTIPEIESLPIKSIHDITLIVGPRLETVAKFIFQEFTSRCGSQFDILKSNVALIICRQMNEDWMVISEEGIFYSKGDCSIMR